MAPNPGLIAGEFPDTLAIAGIESAANGEGVTIRGTVSVRPSQNAAERVAAATLRLTADGKDETVNVEPDGQWSIELPLRPSQLDLVSPHGGSAHWQAGAPLLAETVRAAAPAHPPAARAVVLNRRHVGRDLR